MTSTTPSRSTSTPSSAGVLPTGYSLPGWPGPPSRTAWQQSHARGLLPSGCAGGADSLHHHPDGRTAGGSGGVRSRTDVARRERLPRRRHHVDRHCGRPARRHPSHRHVLPSRPEPPPRGVGPAPGAHRRLARPPVQGGDDRQSARRDAQVQRVDRHDRPPRRRRRRPTRRRLWHTSRFCSTSTGGECREPLPMYCKTTAASATPTYRGQPGDKPAEKAWVTELRLRLIPRRGRGRPGTGWCWEERWVSIGLVAHGGRASRTTSVADGWNRLRSRAGSDATPAGSGTACSITRSWSTGERRRPAALRRLRPPP